MNALAAESSPYLLQHSENPVDWMPWGVAAFDKARKLNRPVFLSIGYSTCHWCHVMAEESFSLLMRAGSEAAPSLVFQTLRMMAGGGIHDHLGGGFHRYSVDRFWHVPHFEKMLYDQAQMAVALTEAWQFTHDPMFAGIARDTLDYAMRDLGHPGGGFFSAEDADSGEAGEHAEGSFYVWTRDEIVSALGDDAEAFCEHFSIREEGNAPEGSDPQGEFDGKNILHQSGTLLESARALGMPPEELRELLDRSRRKLLAIRNKRPRPHRDDKILTAWNGLMISALAKAGAALGEERYLLAARRAVDFVNQHLLIDGHLRRTWRGEASAIPGFCEDYAFFISGLLDYYEATGESPALQQARELQSVQDELFFDKENGGYFTSSGADPLLRVRLKGDHDGAEPLADSVAAMNLLRLDRIFGETSRADHIFRAWGQAIDHSPTAFPAMLAAMHVNSIPAKQAVVAGAPGSPEVKETVHLLHADFEPSRIVLFADGSKMTPGNMPPEIAGMTFPPGGVRLYLCEDFVCQAPIEGMEAIRKALGSTRPLNLKRKMEPRMNANKRE